MENKVSGGVSNCIVHVAREQGQHSNDVAHDRTHALKQVLARGGGSSSGGFDS